MKNRNRKQNKTLEKSSRVFALNENEKNRQLTELIRLKFDSSLYFFYNADGKVVG